MQSRRLGASFAPLFLTVLLLGNTFSATATTVTYDVNNVGANTWEYTYTVSNDMLSVDIEEFTIFFDVGLYENLVATSIPADWDPLVIQPDPFIPPSGDDGFYDALALAVGIGPGESLGGFGVRFDYLGSGVPGAQFFDVIDPFSFASLDSGFTQVIPVPAAALLFISGLIGFAGPAMVRKCTPS